MRSTFRPDPAAMAKAADADRVVSGAGAQLNYLSHVSGSLGLPDPVQEYFGPIVGRWRDRHDQADVWRRAAAAVEELADGVTAPLGRLDAAWHGAVSDSFLDHMRQVGAAGTSAADAMATMAEVLDTTAEAMHQLVTDTVDLLAGGADRVSLAMVLPVGGPARAGDHIAELRGHGRRMLEAVHDLLEAFAQTCESLDGRQPFAEVKLATTFPEHTWTFRPELSAAGSAAGAAGGDPAAGAVDSGPAGAASGGGGGSGGSGGALGGGSAGVGGLGGGGLGGGGGSAGAAGATPEPAMRTFAAEPVAGGAAGAGAGQPAAGAAAAAGGQRAAGGFLGAPFMPMGAMGGQGGDTERKAKSNLIADPVEIFGEPSKTAPPVIGDD